MNVKRGGNSFNPELLNTDIIEDHILSQKTAIFTVTDVYASNIM
jgi:hypothetical protein